MVPSKMASRPVSYVHDLSLAFVLQLRDPICHQSQRCVDSFRLDNGHDEPVAVAENRIGLSVPDLT